MIYSELCKMFYTCDLKFSGLRLFEIFFPSKIPFNPSFEIFIETFRNIQIVQCLSKSCLKIMFLSFKQNTLNLYKNYLTRVVQYVLKIKIFSVSIKNCDLYKSFRLSLNFKL